MAKGSPRLWRAPAKVNLTLSVLGRRADGWHELDSVVAFAGCCDWLAFEPAETLSLTIAGPTAAAAGPTDDNLVLRAARALAERVPRLRLGRFHLRKGLPVAAGLGGGSSDAAAALRALAAANGLAPDDERLFAAAAAVSSDAPVCLCPSARSMAGRGERLGPALGLPPLPAVLANPGVAVATPAVFAALGPCGRALRSMRRPPRGSRPAVTRRARSKRSRLAATICRRARSASRRRSAIRWKRWRSSTARGWRACRARAPPASRCSTTATPPPAPRARSRRPSRLVGARDVSQVEGEIRRRDLAAWAVGDRQMAP